MERLACAMCHAARRSHVGLRGAVDGVVMVGRRSTRIMRPWVEVRRRLLSSASVAPIEMDHIPASGQPLVPDVQPPEDSKPKEDTGATQGKRQSRFSSRPRPAPIKLTDRAADRIKDLLSHKDKAVGVRLGVKRRGCNGLSYTMNYVESPPKGDDVVAEKGVTVYVDPMALFTIVGTTMDYEETDLSAEFTFNNPNAKSKCGCGESFNV